MRTFRSVSSPVSTDPNKHLFEDVGADMIAETESRSEAPTASEIERNTPMRKCRSASRGVLRVLQHSPNSTQKPNIDT